MTPAKPVAPEVTMTDVERVWAGTISSHAEPGTSLKTEAMPQVPDSFADVTQTDGGPPARLTATLRTRSLRLPETTGTAAARAAAGNVDFALLQVLGQGGMGMVYRARQTAVDREIAVKLIKPGLTDQPGVREAFFTEAVVTADLDHPNIVPIHDLGITGEGRLFYAMKEVRGVSWAKAIREKNLDENLEVLLRVCDAVAFAHARDVVHRDLKPENVMLGEFGEVLVMDWGLAVSVTPQGKAKRLEAGAGPAGTPAYMAPEMARGDWAAIGPASDVYLLGAIIFEFVTGKRPHTGTNVRECLLAAANNVIQPTEASGELLRIALQAMATDPAARHANVKAFQEALRDYRKHAQSVVLADEAQKHLQQLEANPEAEQYRECNEIIAGFQQALKLWLENAAAVQGLRQARETFAHLALRRGDLSLAQSQVTAIESEVGKYTIGGTPLAPPTVLADQVTTARAESARRDRRARVTRRMAMGLGMAVIIVSVGAYLITKQQRDRAVTAEKTALEAKARTEAANRELEQQNYINLMTAVQAKLDMGTVNQAEALLWQTPVKLRGWEWGYQIQRCHPELLSLPAPASYSVSSVAVSKEGRQILVGTDGPAFAVYNCADGSVLWQVKVSDSREFFLCAAFVGGDGAVVTGAMSGRVAVWEPGTDKWRWTATGHQGYVAGVAVSPDGKRIVSWGLTDKTVRMWDAVTGKLSWSGDGYSKDMAAAAFSPDGQRVVVAYRDGHFLTFGANSGKELQRVKIPFSGVSTMAFSPDETQIASNGNNGAVVWQTADPKQYISLYGHSSWVRSIAFMPDGQSVLTTSNDGSARLWEAATGREIRRFLGHTGTVFTAAFFPDGQRFVTAGNDDRHAKIWATAGTSGYRTLNIQTSNVFSLAFSPNNTHMLAGCWEDGQAKLMSIANGECVRVFKGHTGPVMAVAFSADGRRVMTGGQDKTVKLWDAATGKELLTLPSQTGAVTGVAFAPDGRTVLTRTRGKVSQATCWDAATGTALWSQNGATGAAYSPDGCHVLAGQLLQDVTTGKTIREFPAEANGLCAFSPDSRYVLVSRYAADPVRLFDVATGTTVREFVGHTQTVTSMGFSPDGQRVVTGSWDETARIWDIATGRELAVVRGAGTKVYSVAFSPDGRLLALGQQGVNSLSILESLPPTTTPEQIQEWKRARYAAWLKANASPK